MRAPRWIVNRISWLESPAHCARWSADLPLGPGPESGAAVRDELWALTLNRLQAGGRFRPHAHRANSTGPLALTVLRVRLGVGPDA
jgi:hypothetical protein